MRPPSYFLFIDPPRERRYRINVEVKFEIQNQVGYTETGVGGSETSEYIELAQLFISEPWTLR